MNERILLATFVALESAHAFSAFLPSVFTIRRFRDAQTARDIRDGEVIAAGFAIAVGAVVSALTKSSLPLIFSVVTALAMVQVYEWALRT
jgi:hypothetical protein